jgi:4-amino-4-deoxy-L-arabinose transferase-like glycosyltransferase
MSFSVEQGGMHSVRSGFLSGAAKQLRSVSTAIQRWPLLVISTVTLLALVPFINRAFHIDDPLFLWAAKQIQNNPSDFYGFDVNWYGTTQAASNVIKNPPLASYYIAFAARFIGWSEIALHSAFLIPALACTIGMYFLARRFCARSILAPLCLLFTPGFLVSSTTVMCDTMMLAFWIWALVLWDKGLSENSFGSIVFATVLVGLSALTKYFGACLIPLLIVHGLARQRRLGTWSLPLLVPIVMLTAYEWYTRQLYGHGLLSDAGTYGAHFGSRDVREYTVVGLAFTGGCVFAPLCYTRLIWPKGGMIAAFVAAALLWLVLATTGPANLLGQVNRDHMAIVAPQIAVLTTLGASILLLPVLDWWRNRDVNSLLLLLWVGGTFVFATLLNWTINARSVLPMCPAIAILLVRRLDLHIGFSQPPRNRLLISLLLLPAGASFLLAAADCRLANSARAAASMVQAKRSGVLGTFWFEGHWGFQYYMQALGAEPLDVTRSEFENGDFIAIPASAANVFSIPKEVLRLTTVVQIGSTPLISTMDRSLGAGFYASEWGPLPFSIGPVAPQRYELFSIIHSIRFVQPGER